MENIIGAGRVDRWQAIKQT